MAIIDKIKAKAQSDVKHIVLPEGDEPRTVAAAVKIQEQGLAKLTLLGNPEKIKEVAAGASLEGINIIDPETSEKSAENIATSGCASPMTASRMGTPKNPLLPKQAAMTKMRYCASSCFLRKAK